MGTYKTLGGLLHMTKSSKKTCLQCWETVFKIRTIKLMVETLWNYMNVYGCIIYVFLTKKLHIYTHIAFSFYLAFSVTINNSFIF